MTFPEWMIDAATVPAKDTDTVSSGTGTGTDTGSYRNRKHPTANRAPIQSAAGLGLPDQGMVDDHTEVSPDSKSSAKIGGFRIVVEDGDGELDLAAEKQHRWGW